MTTQIKLIKRLVEKDDTKKAYKKFSGKRQHYKSLKQIQWKATTYVYQAYQKVFPLTFEPIKESSSICPKPFRQFTDPIVYWKVQSWLFRATTSVKNLYWFILNQQLNAVLCLFAFTAN